MSRSQPANENPAKRFFRWSGSKGQLAYWDKELKKDIPVKLPFEFLVLDQLATITGYSDQDSSGFWSNEVRSTKRDPFTVKTSAGTKEVGLYADLAESRSKGAKYAQSIYMSFKENEEDGFVIGNIKASGACLNAWIELSKKCAIGNGKVRLTGSIEGKKGRNTYQIPVFEWDHSEDDEDKIAIELDKELQVYLSQYLSKNATSDDEAWPSKQVDDIVETNVPDSENDDEAQEAIAKAVSKNIDDMVEGEKLSIEDVPF